MRSMNLHFAFLAGAIQIGALAVSSCGAGTAAIVSGNGGSSGSTTVQPAVAALGVENPKEPDQAKLHFTLSKEATVKLFYQRPGALPGDPPLPPQAMTQAGPNPRTFPAGASPMIAWNFALEAGLDASFHRDVRVFATIPGAQEQQTEGANALTLGLGNDAPVVEQAREPTSEVAGIVAVRLKVSDSSRDEISIRAEFDVLGDVPDLGFQLARPGGLLPLEPTPHFAFTGVVAPERGAGGTGGVELDFFWNTDVDLEDLERDARLRFTSVDPIVEGVPKETGPIHVDNNAAPIVQLLNDAVITNPDERRGIPVPFRVFDEEEDVVEAIFQWRREGEEFPSLDTNGDGQLSNAEIDAIRADPLLRAEHHIATAFPHFARGLVVPVDATTVRLPELARGESWILAAGLEGRSLEILRPSSIPAAPAWSTNPLNNPIAALPLGDGLTALVLDMPGNGRLREIELATGTIVQRNGRNVIASIPPAPTAIALEREEEAVLIASDSSGTWRIDRVELATGMDRELIASDGSQPGPVRGIASLGSRAAVFTVGSVLFHLDYRDLLAPRLRTLLSGLATPWGVVVDPLPPDRLYVSERDGDRVLAVELDSHGKTPVVVRAGVPATLEAPEALALERGGSRMLIVTTEPGGAHQLVGLGLGAQGANVSFAIGPPITGEVGNVASGPDGLRILTRPAARELLVAGGLEQHTTISAHSTSSQNTTVAPPFRPVPTPGQPWRIAVESVFRAKAQGVTSLFVWDSADAGGGRVFLRAAVRDDEFGATADSEAPKTTRFSLDVEPQLVATFAIDSVVADLNGDGALDLALVNTVFPTLSIGFQGGSGLGLGPFGNMVDPRSITSADLDRNGLQDLASANAGSDNLTVFFQRTTGQRFFSPDVALADFSGTMIDPVSIAAADLNGDGNQDLVSANAGSNNLTVFLQTLPGFFGPDPHVRLSFATMFSPRSVAAADLDGDGDQDLVSANAGSNNLTVFFELSFGATPLPLGPFPSMVTPVSIAAADLDGDGDQDLVSANQGSNTLTVFFQSTPGSFETPPVVLRPFPTTTTTFTEVTAADIDADGDLDLIAASGIPAFRFFLQGPPGSFEEAPSLSRVRAASVAAADFEGDGDMDLVSATDVYFQRLPEGFETPHAPQVTLDAFATTVDPPASVAAADLDGDGDHDLVSANQGSNTLTVFRQRSPGSFETPPMVLGPFPTMMNGPRSVAAADLDGDGEQDLVSANQNSNTLTVFFQGSSPGSFETPPVALGPFPTMMNGPRSVAAADLDGDGDQDIVSANAGSNTLTVFFHGSPRSFKTPPLALGPFPAMPVSVAAADLDGDGDQDLVSANQDSNTLSVFFQNSPGTFEAPRVDLFLAQGSGPASVAAADLDGDGDQDLVSANQDSNTLTIFFLSQGEFFTTVTLGPFSNLPSPTMVEPVSVAAADFDGDGDQDLVSANAGDFLSGFANGTLTVFFQRSPGSFTPPVVFHAGRSPVSIATADLDGDGDQDLVSANAGFGSPDTLTIFFGR